MAARDHRRYARSVTGHRRQIPLPGREHHKAVHKIHMIPLLQPFRHCVGTQDLQPVPADLRQLQFGWDAADPPRQQPQPLTGPHFVRLLKQHLHPQTNAEKGLFRRRSQHRIGQPGSMQCIHRIRECTDAGQDHTGCPFDDRRAVRDLILAAQKIQRIVHAHQIARAVIYNCNVTHVHILCLSKWIIRRAAAACAPTGYPHIHRQRITLRSGLHTAARQPCGLPLAGAASPSKKSKRW